MSYINPARACMLIECRVFRTSHENVNINETSSYIDLAPLYGCNQEAQDRVRMRDGRGYLSPDTFAEDRLLLLPPAVAILLVLFNRNHNVSNAAWHIPDVSLMFLFSTLRRSSSRSTSAEHTSTLTVSQHLTPSAQTNFLPKKRISSKRPVLSIAHGSPLQSSQTTSARSWVWFVKATPGV